MRSDGLQANVTLYLASPERVDLQEIEDGSGTAAKELAICTTPPATTHRPFWGYLATNKPMSELMADASRSSSHIENQFFALSCETPSR